MGVEKSKEVIRFPSHCRRYLDNDGFGAGTPGQRQRQHQQIRAMQAAESVRKHRVEKMREKDEDAWVGLVSFMICTTGIS